MPDETTRQKPTSDQVRAVLARIVVSPAFATAERMRRFLTFVVGKSLEGEADKLKEYLLGVEVFDRGPDFDPRTDTIVRVEARRLRRKLQEYYAGDGRVDSIVISVPSGSYAPLFERRQGTLASAMQSSVSSERIGSVAVLPFVDMSAAKDQEYFCDGISEELTNALSAIPSLKVVARTSAFRYKGKAENVCHIGAELGVEHLVEGSLRIANKRLRVTAQLVRTWDGYHVWSRQFERELTDIFSIQDELARAVARSVGSELASGFRSARTDSLEAYRSYLEGRQHWRQFTPAAMKAAIECFELPSGPIPLLLLPMPVWPIASCK